MNSQLRTLFSSFAGFIIGCFMVHACAEQKLSAQDILTKCYHEGSDVVAKELTSNGQEGWFEATDHIATGDGEWIKVVPCMIYGMRSSSSESAAMFLYVALGRALPKNPAAILALDDADVSTKRTCSFPFYEGNEEPLDSYVEETLAALAALESNSDLDEDENEELRDDARICAARLKKSYEIIKARDEQEMQK